MRADGCTTCRGHKSHRVTTLVRVKIMVRVVVVVKIESVLKIVVIGKIRNVGWIKIMVRVEVKFEVVVETMKTLYFIVGTSCGYLLAPHLDGPICSAQKEQIRARLDACLDVATQATNTAQRCSETLLKGLGLKDETKNSCGD